MHITHGLMAGQVLQRNQAGRGGASISGSCEAAAGEVELRVLKGGKVVPGHDWKPAGVVVDGTFRATLADLRSGGPYRVECRIQTAGRGVASVALDEIFVGDVWILAGQSNMEGIGHLDHAPRPHANVRAFYMRDEWGLAEEKLHYLEEAVDRVHNQYGNEPGRPPKEILAKGRAAMIKGVSPGLAFALEMHRRTRVPQGLIPCAHGGTSMAQWSPALRDRGGESLYGAMMRRFTKLGQPVAGMLWYQGESDANAKDAAVYTDKMIELVAATRRDMELPRLPWLVVQLGCHASPEDGRAWNAIQEQQRRLPACIRHLDVAPAIDLELDDGIHIGGRAQHTLGWRLARLADCLVHRTPGVQPSLSLRKIELVPTPGCLPSSGCTAVRLHYRHVVGGLVSNGRPHGFSLHDEHGRNVCNVYKTTLKGSTVTLHTGDPRHVVEMLSVSYGDGRFPVCNITDREGMSLPAIQTLTLAPGHARHCVNWQSAHLSSGGTVGKIGFATAEGATGWRKAPPRNMFGVLPKPADSGQTGLFVMRTTLTATEPLTARLTFGANAPFKIWLNGSLVLKDLACAIPLKPDQYAADLKLRCGENTLLVCFAPPHEAAHFGIFARVGTCDGKSEPRLSF